MPNENLVKPERPKDWRLYHAASKSALDEGETAERQSSEGRGGFDSYANFARSSNSSSSSAASEFDGWRRKALATRAETYRLADVERANFGRIAEAERQKNRLPVIKDVDLCGLCNDIAVRPPSLDENCLVSRRGLFRPPLEVMLDALLQHGIASDAAGFQQVLDDARLRVTRGAGDLASVFEAFMKATHVAAAARFNETVPSSTWASDEQIEHVRKAGDALTAALRA